MYKICFILLKKANKTQKQLYCCICIVLYCSHCVCEFCVESLFCNAVICILSTFVSSCWCRERVSCLLYFIFSVVFCIRGLIRIYILAHRIRISEILPWNGKSYLTHAILPRLFRESYIHWLYWKSRTWSSNDVIVMFKWRHHVELHLSLFRDFWKLILK